MGGYFPAPPSTLPPDGGMVRHYVHTHEWVEWGAAPNLNGTWSALYRCEVCTDVAVGDHVGPIPPGFCYCGWVQRDLTATRCEDCGSDLP